MRVKESRPELEHFAVFPSGSDDPVRGSAWDRRRTGEAIVVGRSGNMAAVEFEIRVAGSLPSGVLEELEGVRVVTESVQTVVRGPVLDQAALIGIINRLQGLGIELRGVRQL